MALQEQVRVPERWNGEVFSTGTHDIESTSSGFWGDRQRKIHSATSAESQKQSRCPSPLTRELATGDNDLEPLANASLCGEYGDTSQEGRQSTSIASNLEPVAQKELRFGLARLTDRWNGRLVIIGFTGLIVTDWLIRTSAIGVIMSSLS
ncbi:hypothetical protein [Vacuolonema iberomarrocanum]|uniref:hypothetical protein n=1 Tax=Vacuolonema iberomarrocanum TaxID=3454632 RepID=UPI001A06E41A|nr:hypothetical protein [filamentous cyanobacterium LEGE 07170]